MADALSLNDLSKIGAGTFEPQRLAARKSFRFCLSFSIPLLILGFIFFILTTVLRWPEAVYGVPFILFIAGIVFLSIALVKKTTFAKKFLSWAQSSVNQALFPNAVYRPNQGMILQKILTPGFFASPDRYIGSDYMTATYDEISFEKARYRLQRRETHTDSKGNTYTTYEDYANGTMYRFQYERNFAQIVKVLEKSGLLTFGSGGMKRVETEYIAFNKKFAIFATDETTVFYLLTPQIQEKILTLEASFKGQFYLAFYGNELYVAINDANQTITAPWKNPITPENLEPLLEVMAIPAVFIKLLGLNKAKFEANAGTASV